MLQLLLAATSLLALPSCERQQPTSPDRPLTGYDRMLRALYRETVPMVQPKQLAATLAEAPGQVLLIDARSPDEYQVSHLQGAQLIAYDDFSDDSFKHLSRDKPVVVYCSVGVRSEKMGERLLALGFKDVRNLYGGVFQWVNDGLPVYNAQGTTQNVHPYSSLWGVWLKRGNQVYK